MPDKVQRLAAALATRYRTDRELGVGGMARVYLAEDLRHHRNVAVKVLRPELAATLGAERFSREIHTAARFQHAHILPLLDSGDADGFLYYVMPHVEGKSLRDRLDREGELPIHDAVKILVQIADALAYAHARGVVHRDIKPDNVLLTGRHALVSDFGVAKAVSEAGAGPSTTTSAGFALGTPSYMAPEQAAADPHIDLRADLYAVGALGYELITGRPPFTGRTPAQILAAQVTETPEPPDARREACPAALSEVIMKCLEKRPADRWQSADELLAALEPFATPSGGTTPVARRLLAIGLGRRRALVATVMIGLGAIFVLVAATALWLRRSPGLLPLGRRLQVTFDPGLEIDPALSPDGKAIAYVAGPPTGTKLFVRDVDGGTAIPVVREPSAWQRHPSWSPDGRRLLFESPRGIEIVTALGGIPRILIRAPAHPVVGGPFAPDGRQFLFASGDSIYVASLDAIPPRLLAAARAVHSFAWSSDGRWIAYVSGNRPYVEGATLGNLAPSSLWVLRVSGGAPVRVTDERSLNVSPVWDRSPGKLLFISDRDGGRDVYQQALRRSGRPDGAPKRITTGLNALAISLSADGTRLAYSQFTETSNVWRVGLPKGAPV